MQIVITNSLYVRIRYAKKWKYVRISSEYN